MTCVDPFSHLRLDLHHCFVLKRALKIGAEESPTTATPALCKSYKKKKVMLAWVIVMLCPCFQEGP